MLMTHPGGSGSQIGVCDTIIIEPCLKQGRLFVKKRLVWRETKPVKIVTQSITKFPLCRNT